MEVNLVRLMVLMRVLIIFWFVLQCLVVPIGAQSLSAPISDLTARDTAEQEEHSAYDEALAEVVGIRNDIMTRRTVPRVSLAPLLIRRIGTAFPRSHALRVHQLISVYRI